MQSSQLKHVLIIGILFTSFFGTLAHFFYEWTGENVLAGLFTPVSESFFDCRKQFFRNCTAFISRLFTPVSESIWEHMKLIFFPMSLYGFLSKKYLKQESPCYCFAYLTGLLAGTLAIPVLFYTYSGILGRNCMIIDILIFYLSVILAFFVVYRTASQCKQHKSPFLPWLFALLLAACFFIFTFFPPQLGIFQG